MPVTGAQHRGQDGLVAKGRGHGRGRQQFQRRRRQRGVVDRGVVAAQVLRQRHQPDAVDRLGHKAHVLGGGAVERQPPFPQGRIGGALGQVERAPDAKPRAFHRGIGDPHGLQPRGGVAHDAHLEDEIAAILDAPRLDDGRHIRDPALTVTGGGHLARRAARHGCIVEPEVQAAKLAAHTGQSARVRRFVLGGRHVKAHHRAGSRALAHRARQSS